jgi:ectoine hydrolase
MAFSLDASNDERIVGTVEISIRECDLVADVYDAALYYGPSIEAGGHYQALVPLLPAGADASSARLTCAGAVGRGNIFEIFGVVKRGNRLL